MSTESDMRAAFKKWLVASVDLLSQYPIPRTTLAAATPDGDGNPILIRHDFRNEFGILVRSHEQELLALPESDQLTKAMVADPKALELFQDEHGATKPERFRNYFIHTAYLHRLLIHYLAQVGTATVVSVEVTKAWNELSRFIYKPTTISVSALVDIRGIDTGFSPVKLDQQTALRPLTVEEQKAYLQAFKASRNDPYFAVPDSFLEVRANLNSQRQIDEQPLWQLAESSAVSALIGLRLLRGEIVGMGDLHVTSTSPLYPPTERRLPIDGTGTEIFGAGAKYPIDPVVAKELPKLWKKHRQLGPDSVLELAIRRLADSYARRNNEDKMVDYWVALEAMFLSDVGGELSYRGSLRVARFAGKTAADRKKAFDDIRASYELRSKIVHGSMGAKHHAALAATTEATAETLRMALRQCLNDGHSPDVDKIDAALLA